MHTYTNTSRHNRGFTLIELLIVLAIIALLASVIFASLGHIQKKSRDTRRMEDVNSIVKSLEIYQTGRNRFPVSVATTTLDGTDDVSLAVIADGAISTMPMDPLHPDYTYDYTTNSLGTDFTIHFCLEGSSIPGYAEGCVNSITP
jgi:general secretion pathway protein G